MTPTSKRSPSATPGRPKTLLSHTDRIAAGKAARSQAALESHAQFSAGKTRDTVGLLLGQGESRVPELLPIRHGRMLVSPFTYFRGAALPMAADLATTSTTGLTVQLCGDAHLANFGAFASPERKLVFDLNDFDETLPGSFEWDVKRLAASLVIAARDNNFTTKEGRAIAVSAVAAYRLAMRSFADQSMLSVWYAHVDIDEAVAGFRAQMKARKLKAKTLKSTEALLAKARTRDSMQVLGKLTSLVDGRRRIISTPPLIVPVEEVFSEVQSDAIYDQMGDLLSKYSNTLQSDRRHLLRQFELVQVARKVVGVGSVGTRAWIILMEGASGLEPLFLQAKEAQNSVLAPYGQKSLYSNQGERVVSGQHLMQANSDIFLGWQRVTGPDGIDRDYYVRQLRDWKFSLPIEQMLPPGLGTYGELCGATLARAHARSGDRVAIAAYLGKSARFENAIADFAETYADQNERDYAALATAVEKGQAVAIHGL
jgi:uncharacterized protein (DUF2252 family)